MTFNNSGPIVASAAIGLRSFHYQDFITKKPKIEWVEVHSENFFSKNYDYYILETIRKDYQLSFHGVNLSLGSYQKPSLEHLKKLRELINVFQPIMFSEHLAWNVIDNIYLNDLLPIPYNEEALKIICRNIEITQDFLGRNIAIENPSTYLQLSDSNIKETDFLNQIVKNTNCKILLDINNVYVSSVNNNTDPYNYLNEINYQAVNEIHLAGHTIKYDNNNQKIILDTHNDLVSLPVWELYKYFLKNHHPIHTLIEWDQDPPQFDTLLSEAQKAQSYINKFNMKINVI